MNDEQHIEMMAAVIAAGTFVNPRHLSLTDGEIANIALNIAREIVRQNREPKP